MLKPEHIEVAAGSDFSMLAEYTAQSCLALMHELEESLKGSQTALLALDVATTERCTEEQLRLQRGLGMFLRNTNSTAISSPAKIGSDFRACSQELVDQLHAAGKRVQHLARVQSALLRRSQQFLCVLANCVAGPEASYGPPKPPGVFRQCHR